MYTEKRDRYKSEEKEETAHLLRAGELSTKAHFAYLLCRHGQKKSTSFVREKRRFVGVSDQKKERKKVMREYEGKSPSSEGSLFVLLCVREKERERERT